MIVPATQDLNSDGADDKIAVRWSQGASGAGFASIDRLVVPIPIGCYSDDAWKEPLVDLELAPIQNERR
jgi:hypothetical protein